MYIADIVILGFVSNEETISENNETRNIKEAKDYVSMLEDHFFSTIWAKSYKLSILKKHGIRFDETLDYGEDTLFNNIYIKHISSLRSLNYVGYNHRNIEVNSLSQNKLRSCLIDRSDYMMRIFNVWDDNTSVQQFWATRFL